MTARVATLAAMDSRLGATVIMKSGHDRGFCCISGQIPSVGREAEGLSSSWTIGYNTWLAGLNWGRWHRDIDRIRLDDCGLRLGQSNGVTNRPPDLGLRYIIELGQRLRWRGGQIFRYGLVRMRQE